MPTHKEIKNTLSILKTLSADREHYNENQDTYFNRHATYNSNLNHALALGKSKGLDVAIASTLKCTGQNGESEPQNYGLLQVKNIKQTITELEQEQEKEERPDLAPKIR